MLREIEVNFPFHVRVDDEGAEALARGDARAISALLYQAADMCVTHGAPSMKQVFDGDAMKRDAGFRVQHLNWLGPVLVWLGGFACGAVFMLSIFSLFSTGG